MPEHDENDVCAANKNINAVRALMLSLFVISFFTIFIALVFVALKTNGEASRSAMPIPLASLILGVLYKKRGFKTTKNIVVGIIFTVLLTIYGSFPFMLGGLYSHDFSYVGRIGGEINFILPDKGNITTQNMSARTQAETDPVNERYLYGHII